MNYSSRPAQYWQIAVMDFVRNRKQMLTVNIGALAVTVWMAVGGIAFGVRDFGVLKTWWGWLLLAALYVAYIPLHELTHGVLMHALSGVKPKYGLKLPYAYAGSSVYFDKRSHNVIALAPLIVWGVVLLILTHALPRAWFWLMYILQISNVSGSMGDVYCVLYLRKSPKDVLIQDTGVRMRIFAPKPGTEEQT